MAYVWNKTFAKLGEDWVFLAVLGILMAGKGSCHVVMDYLLLTTW